MSPALNDAGGMRRGERASDLKSDLGQPSLEANR
jgi:hypothetical protein